MNTHQILADKAVSVSDARKNLSQYFTDEPVVVLSNNKPAGYMVGAELFEGLMQMVKDGCLPHSVGKFNPSDEEFNKMAAATTEALLKLSDDELGEFYE